MAFQLVVVRGRSNSTTHRLAAGVTVVGRQDGCQLQIRSSQVSRKHCELFERDGQLVVKDLGSSNGTFVNGRKVEGEQPLRDGDELSIGGVTFRVAGGEAGASPADTAPPVAVAAADVMEDDEVIALDDDEPTAAASPESKKAAGSKSAVAKAPAAKRPEPEPEPEGSEIGEDAVADFLMGLDLDE